MADRRDSRPERPTARQSERQLLAALAPHASPDLTRSVWQLGSSLVAFAALCSVAFYTIQFSYALTLAIAVPAAVTLVRLFIIQHDCGHGAFFESRLANHLVGSFLGVLTLTPFAYWRKLHALHHATSGNLDKRGFGNIRTLTVREYLALGRWSRLRYRLYRNPVMVFIIGPACQFFILHRLPTNLHRTARRERSSVFATNIALIVAFAVLVKVVGFERLLLVVVPIDWIAASIGVWLFYVQHQFEETYWEPDAKWSFEAAGLAGSSYYDLPAFLHWCTGNIGFHHIHHLCPRIPNYHLKNCLNAHPELAGATRLTLVESLRCIRLKLWDEDHGKLVALPDAFESRVQ
jgi:acyl-lipid omega-6 desaturase (Delta-12 desaturase)